MGNKTTVLFFILAERKAHRKKRQECPTDAIHVLRLLHFTGRYRVVTPNGDCTPKSTAVPPLWRCFSRPMLQPKTKIVEAFGGYSLFRFSTNALRIRSSDGTPPPPSYVRHIIPNAVRRRADGSISEPLIRTVGNPRNRSFLAVSPSATVVSITGAMRPRSRRTCRNRSTVGRPFGQPSISSSSIFTPANAPGAAPLRAEDSPIRFGSAAPRDFRAIRHNFPLERFAPFSQ